MTPNPRDCFHSCSILGAFFAANPIADAVLVYHGPAGCVKMVLHAACAHDWLGLAPRKVTLCEVGDREVVTGGAEKLRAHIALVRERFPGKHVFVVSSCAPEIVGDDLLSAVEGFGPGAVTLLGGAGFRGDLWAGASDALERIAAGLCTEAPGAAPEEGKVNLVGYLCDRLEQDHLANVRVLRELVAGAGLELNALFVGPGEVSGLRRAWAAGTNVAFAYGEKAAQCLAARYGQKVLRVEYPIGLRSTIAFLRALAGASGREHAPESYIEAKLRWAVPRLQAARATCLGKRVGVCAESQKLPGLTEFLRDLGMIVSWVQVKDQGGAQEGRAGKVDLIVGSSVEKYRFGGRVPVYEFTYPCFDRHCLGDEPDLGFEGAVRLANNLANLLSRPTTRILGLSRELSRLEFDPVFYAPAT